MSMKDIIFNNKYEVLLNSEFDWHKLSIVVMRVVTEQLVVIDDKLDATGPSFYTVHEPYMLSPGTSTISGRGSLAFA